MSFLGVSTSWPSFFVEDFWTFGTSVAVALAMALREELIISGRSGSLGLGAFGWVPMFIEESVCKLPAESCSRNLSVRPIVIAPEEALNTKA